MYCGVIFTAIASSLVPLHVDLARSRSRSYDLDSVPETNWRNRIRERLACGDFRRRDKRTKIARTVRPVLDGHCPSSAGVRDDDVVYAASAEFDLRRCVCVDDCRGHGLPPTLSRAPIFAALRKVRFHFIVFLRDRLERAVPFKPRSYTANLIRHALIVDALAFGDSDCPKLMFVFRLGKVVRYFCSKATEPRAFPQCLVRQLQVSSSSRREHFVKIWMGEHKLPAFLVEFFDLLLRHVHVYAAFPVRPLPFELSVGSGS